MNHLRFPPFTIEFKNLTRNKIAFISKKVYQRNTQPALILFCPTDLTCLAPDFACNMCRHQLSIFN